MDPLAPPLDLSQHPGRTPPANLPQQAGRTSSLAAPAQTTHARGVRGRFVPAPALSGGAASAAAPARAPRATTDARKSEYGVFLRVFLLPSSSRDDWVPYAQGSSSPLTRLYEAAVEPKFRVGAGSRAGLSRRFYYGPAGESKTGLPRRNVVDPVHGTRARTRLFTERRLPRPGTAAEMEAVRNWLQALEDKGFLKRCWKSGTDALGVILGILGTYTQGVHGWGYCGYPAVTDARNCGRGAATGGGEEDVRDIEIDEAFGGMGGVGAASAGGLGGGGDGMVDVGGSGMGAAPAVGGGVVAAGVGGAGGAGGERATAGAPRLGYATKEVFSSFHELVSTAGGGGADVRIDDAVRELRCVLIRVGAVGDIGDDDELADILEEASGKDRFRVDSTAFCTAFHATVARRNLVLPAELPKEFGECFLAAAAPAAELGCRQAARVLVKVWNDTKSTTPVTVQDFQQQQNAASGNVPLVNRELDVGNVRTMLREFCGADSDQLEVTTFEKAARQILFEE